MAQKLLTLLFCVFIFLGGCKKDADDNSSPPKEKDEVGLTRTEGTSADATETEVTNAAAGQSDPEQALMAARPLEGLTWVKGGPVTFEKGHVYVVEFWATWCPPCRTSIPHLTEVQNQFKGQKVTVIGISDEEKATVAPFVEQQGDTMDYVVACDPSGENYKNYMERFHQSGIPHAFVVDKNGHIAWHGHPMGGLDQILPDVVAGSFDPLAWQQQEQQKKARMKKLNTLWMDYFQTIADASQRQKNRQIADEIIDLASADYLNEFAWKILTDENIPYRDNEIALEAAVKANELTDKNNPSVLDTYALALFRNGEVAQAITVQEKAVDLSQSHPQMNAELKQRLEEYRAAQSTQL